MTRPKTTNKRTGKNTTGAAETAAEDTQIADFEGALDELDTLVEQMEAGDLTLEESLQAFERGIALTRSCQQALKQAELRVRTLSTSAESDEPEEPEAVE